jgi:Ca-activated chloride channel family protein
MRVRSLVLFAALGIVTSSAGALAIPVSPHALPSPDGAIQKEPSPSDPPSIGDPSHFVAGRTLAVDARLGHATLRQSAGGETFLFASVTGEGSSAASPPMSLAIVIDRSGSMAGVRIANAIAAAVSAVDRMREGDRVTVVTFDTAAKVVVPPTRTTASSRSEMIAAIRGIRLGGDTCISCGLEEAMRQLDGAAFSRDEVRRMILLSDGEATHGIKDVPGLRAMASQMRERGLAITTIGVDVSFDEKSMAAIASESNGRHYFVANPSGLPAIFAEEFDSIAASVAQGAELAIDLAPGVEVEEVFDRSFRREGTRIIVPFGTFATREEKTVLMRVRVPSSREGSMPIADLALSYRDLIARTEGRSAGSLGLVVKNDGSEQRELDPFVAARIERSRTSQTLTRANVLFEQGRVDEARAALQNQHNELAKAEALALGAPAKTAVPKTNGRGLKDDFAEQDRALAEAQSNLAPVAGSGGGASGASAPAAAPIATSTAGRASVRSNQSKATDMAF